MLTAGRGASSAVGGGRESHPRVLSLTRTAALGQRSGELEAVRESRARSVEGRRQDITGSLEGEGKVAGRVAEIKNPIAHRVVMRNLIRSLEKGPAGRVASGGS